MRVFAKKLAFRWGTLRRRAGAPSLAGLHSAPETFRILERERARADRSHEEFSLIAFSVRNPRTDEAPWPI
jgi:hypothetical protein